MTLRRAAPPTARGSEGEPTNARRPDCILGAESGFPRTGSASVSSVPQNAGHRIAPTPTVGIKRRCNPVSERARDHRRTAEWIARVWWGCAKCGRETAASARRLCAGWADDRRAANQATAAATATGRCRHVAA